MRSITVSAPGKLMLFGEHAVLHGGACIVTAVNQRMRATVELTSMATFQLHAPDVGIVNYKKPLSEIGVGNIPKGAKFVETAFSLIKPRLARLRGIKVTTQSQFSSRIGFGSSSAVTVCVLKALSELFNVKLSQKELFSLAYKTVLDVQKKGSGFDVAAAIYGGALYFVSAGKIIEQLNIESLPLVIGYSGIKADTVTIMNQVLEKTKENPQAINQIYDQIGIIVEKAKETIERKDWKTTGELMNRNQELLKELGVSTKKIDEMIAISLRRGALGAKLSGAGGGDCMIALCLPKNKKIVANAINNVGGEVIDVSINAKGIEIEQSSNTT